MARPHHRKKHKEHLRQFKHSHEVTKTVKAKEGSATVVFALGGAIVGLLLGYFAGGGSVAWLIGGFVVAGVGGYLIGQRIDHSGSE